MPTPVCYTREELAEITGASTSQIKRWSHMGLFSPLYPRSLTTFNNVYRAYGDHHIREIRQIMAILEQNRTLDDIRDILHPEREESEAI